jgi:TonB family protein
LVAFVAALAAHVVGIALFAVLGGFDRDGKLMPSLQPPLASSLGKPPPEDERPMEISTLVDELRRPELENEEEKKREEERKKEEEAKSPPGQVVDVARPLIEQRPDKADYVSEYDTKVDHETKGPSGRDHAGARDGAVPMVMPAPRGDSPNARPQAAVQPSGKPGRPGPLAMRELAQRRPQPESANADSPPPDRDGDRPRVMRAPPSPAPRPPAETGEGGEGAARASPPHESGTPGEQRPNLQPTPEMLARAIGKGGGSMDYLKDVDDGDATALNSKKWKHAPFFNRVKRAVADEWHPEVVYVRHDPNGNVYGVKDRVTVLSIHLTPDGKLAGWTVRQSSGVDFLDDEAIEAFRRAAPFPNPPKDLVESDGKIHFNFAFIFELSGHGSLKLFKYN